MLSAYQSAEVALRGTTKVKLSGQVAESTHRRMSNGEPHTSQVRLGRRRRLRLRLRRRRRRGRIVEARG